MQGFRISCCLAWGALLLAAFTLDVSGADAVPRKRVLIVTGVDYPGHLWRKTAPLIEGIIAQDPRLEVFTIEDPHFLDSAALSRYSAIIMHWQNWQQPGPASAARENLKAWSEAGGGVVIVHFACGAWHGEWGGYEQVAGRVWAGPGPGVAQHDPYGKFRVKIAGTAHPITAGLKEFETTDELYTCLAGTRPIEVLGTATSKVDGKDYPIFFTSASGKGRVFHCTLGHDTAALENVAVKDLYRRGTAWSAQLDPAPVPNETSTAR